MDEDAADRILRMLVDGLDRDVRQSVIRRFDAMKRELVFRWSQNDGDAAFLRRIGYTSEQLHTLFALNSFYQIVLGPLAAASRRWRTVEFNQLTILHGRMSFGPTDAVQLREMVSRFERILGEIDLPRFINTNTAGDLIYQLARFERDREELP